MFEALLEAELIELDGLDTEKETAVRLLAVVVVLVVVADEDVDDEDDEEEDGDDIE